MIAAVVSFFAAIPAASARNLAASLANTKWSWSINDTDKTNKSNAWVIFLPDGTLKKGWGHITPSWKALDSSRIEIAWDPKKGGFIILHFNEALTEAVDEKTHIVCKRLEMTAGYMDEKKGGQGGQSVAEASPTPPVSAEVQQAASDLIKTYHNSLVFATGNEGAGSGFIATLGGGNFLFTNAHVEAGITGVKFKTLDGTDLQAGEASVAVGEDVFCMAQQGGGKPFEIMQGVEANAGIGDTVVVLGNAEGGGVVNTIIGKIVGIGPNLVEIDAPFVSGNSGSPIIHLKTGKVIGVATYSVTRKYDVTTDEKLRKFAIRRFGYRIDTVKKWQPVNWQSFYAQASRMKDIETLTNDLYNFFVDLSENKNSITIGQHTNPVIKTRIDQWIADKSHRLSTNDSQWADANFLSFLKTACQTDVAGAQRQMTYDYFQRELGDQQGYRNEMSKAFEEIIKGLKN